MQEYKNPMEEINKLSHLLPSFMLEDINKRIGDWLLSGGKETDNYVWQQLRFVQDYLTRRNSIGGIRNE